MAIISLNKRYDVQELFCDTGIVVFVKLLALLLVANCSPQPKVRG